ncbi:DNA polymerase theta-like isoform X1 [Tripterygium wilfordii]|uniref:DNA polymerase theta-like isoform X1 n=1 Tax=Tripterygium wilfordii TaxID=458696 RepID=A0A7J7DPG5_TRIWF|nr:helicase and polymerase-containing protein TEBICHI isoform X3 [Tripterygium wilfordii]KAF5748241.1 DNA polymerase theta-like isoform X1 [Tripterygium wilfordii]
MASDSPRKRIDQFFASKKRKSLSPSLKCGRIENDSKPNVNGSPSAKGTLDSYLVASQNDEDIAKPSHASYGLSAGQHLVKRNLASGINKSFEDRNEQPLSHAQISSKTDVAIGVLPKGFSETMHVTENSELKRFATDFLSLYCSELHSSVSLPSEPKENDCKRHGSSSLLSREDKSSKKRHRITNQSEFDSEYSCSSQKSPVDMQSGFIDKSRALVIDSSKEVAACSDLTEFQASLRKCNAIHKCTASRTELGTPSCSINKTCGRSTPRSTRGCSLFSPGEAFWNEAIQVADGLFPQTDEFLVQSAEETYDARKQSEVNKSCNLNHRRCDDTLKESLDEGEKRARTMGIGSSSDLVGNMRKDSVKEASPLPVKHFDFMEDQNLKEIAPDRSVHDSQIEMQEADEEPKSHSVLYKPCTDSITTHSDEQANAEMHEEEKMVSFKNLIAANEVDGAGTPSSSVTLKDSLDLSHWLPSEVCCLYRKKGISKLYPWQVSCLQVDGVLQRRNLVYCASTSAGKSFVAEILMLRRVMSSGKIAILVLPYVSICAEKAEHLEYLLEPLGKQVRSYYGSQGGGTLHKDTSIAVCTIEKANALINRLLEEGRLSEIGIIVIDELHMVGDQTRGYLLELMLTKLRYACGEGNSESSSGESSGTSSSRAGPAHGLQIVGMSATMPNVGAVADWLQAALYQTDFRPVPLEECIKVGNTIYNKKMDIIRTIPKAAALGGKDPDHIVELCNEVVQEGHSVLIFCSSRKGCESTARHVSKFLKKFSFNIPSDSEFLDIASAIDALRRCPVGLDPILEETLPSGVAYHHAGLTVEEREIVESCYRRGLIRVLTATSTLAAGVNLPARRVIFRQPRIGRDFIDGTRYRQMAGRAGRTGIDTKGESVLICKSEEIKRIMGLLNESCPPLSSCLSEDKNGMTHAILEVVAGGIVQTAHDIHRYVRCTLLNSTKPFEDVVKSAKDSLRCLCHRKFLEWNEDTKLYNTTSLGRAAFGSSLCPEESLIVLDDLSRAREGFVLASDLHLVYLVTPISVDVEPDWELYYERFMELSALDQSVGNRVGVTEPFLMRMAHGAPVRISNRSRENMTGLHREFVKPGIINTGMISDEQMLRVCRRFYVALILSRLVQESPVAEVCEAFKVSRGMVQALQENAGRFASMVSLFCERLGWHDLEILVSKFQNRVSFGVRAEIAELTTIPYVKGSRARALYKAGFRTPLAIAEASVPEIAKALFESSSWAAQGLAQRHMQLGVAKKIKNGARKIVLDKAEEARIAAFSAFKSLGFDIPQIAVPLLSNTRQLRQGTGSTSSGDNPAYDFLGAEEQDGSAKPSSEGSQNSENVAPESEVDKLAKALEGGFVTEAEVNPSGSLQCDFSAQTSLVPVGRIAADKLDAIVEHKEVPDMAPSIQLGKDVHGTRNGNVYEVQEQHFNQNALLESKDNAIGKGPITAINAFGGLDSFLDLWDTLQEFYFDIHYEKRSEVNSLAPFEIHGIAVCWENSPVYYVNLPRDLLCFGSTKSNFLHPNASQEKRNSQPPENWFEIVKQGWSRIGAIMGKIDVKKFTWNLKVQIQVLKRAAVSIQRFGFPNLTGKSMDFELIDNLYLVLAPFGVRNGIDICIVAWILSPDEERSSNPNLEKEIKKRLSNEVAATAHRCGRWKNQTRRAAHDGCCRRVAQTRALCSVLWKLLISEELVQALMSTEILLVNVLADMELWGIGVDMEGCLQARSLLRKKIACLEAEAYKLSGRRFSLYNSADIANVLYEHLKLPVPDGHDKGKQHPSTDKHCLDILRHEHPIIPVIREHRSLAKLSNCTLGSICSLSRLSMKTQKYTLHGRWLQTSTATGRLSMEEPNLQCVEHMVDFEMIMDKNGGDAEHHKINARDFFVPTQDNWLLLAADYSQIELRLMAHFSEDSALIELLSKPHGDVFTMIAAKWTGKSEDSVGSRERDQTKRLVYGILYGMGANTLAEQLNCSSDEAKEKIKSFKSSFPGVSSWLHEAVSSCREKGYVETLKGRRRYLSKIKCGNCEEISRAQRQAVNSICQGSAADIIKIAMINIYYVVAEENDQPESSSSLATKFRILKGRCRILLQVHDELVLEADPCVIKEAALLLRVCMESAASLLVPLHVKVKIGRTWGSLEPFQAEYCMSDITVPKS